MSWFSSKKLAPFLRYKCHLICFVILVILIFLVVAAKLFISAALNEVEEASFDKMLKGDDLNELTEENFQNWWVVDSDLRKKFSSTMSGFDFQDRPVTILPVGKWDVKAALYERPDNEERLHEYAESCITAMFHSLKLRNSTHFVLIADFDDYSYGQFMSFKTIKFLIQMAKKYQAVFDHMAYGFSLNMDYVSQELVSVIRPLLGSNMDKIEMWGTDRNKFIPAILKRIPANQLPPEYGGSPDYRPVAVF